MSNFDELLKKSEQTDIQALLSAKEAAKRAVLEDPSQINLGALDKANKMLSSAIEKQNSLKSMEEVLDYLTGELGRKIGKSKLYEDKRAGFLRAAKDGSFSKRAVNAYAATLPLAAGVPEPQADKAAALALRRALAEAEKAEESAKLLARKREILEGKYILRSQLEMLLAARAVTLEVELRAMLDRDADEFIEAASGNPQTRSAFTALFVKKIEQLLSDYTRLDELEVEFEPDQSDMEEEDADTDSD